jgi:hypothetical protein
MESGLPMTPTKSRPILHHAVLFAVCIWFVTLLPIIRAQQPTATSQVISVFPNFGSYDGGTPVTVTGSGFLNSWTMCSFGSIAQ